MAIGGRARFTVDSNPFNRRLQVAMSHVYRGTKKATIAASEEILEESLRQVPRETNTLAESAFYQIHGSYRNFTSIIGYGGNGDPINPKTFQRASQYMIIVHEDLEAYHPVGKAKYLEDPVRAYQKRLAPRFNRFIREELS